MYEKKFTTLTFYCFEKAHFFGKVFIEEFREKTFLLKKFQHGKDYLLLIFFIEKFSFIFIFKKKKKKGKQVFEKFFF